MGKRIPAVLFTISLFLGSSLFANVGAFAAGQDSSVLELVLNQSKAAADQKVAELQNGSMAVPDSVNSTYSKGLAEYQTALSLENTDLSDAKAHALKAMDLFTNTIQLVESQENGPSEANYTATLAQSIEDSQNSEAQIQALAEANGIPASAFKGYQDAINAATAAIASGNIQSAKQQILIAQGLLDKVYQQLQDLAQTAIGSRASTFRDANENILSQMIKNAQSSGLDQATINTLQAELDKLEAAKTTSQIIDATNQSSQLQDTISQYDNQSLANFDKESSNIAHEIGVLQGMAAQNNLQLAGIETLSSMLADIKQKMANGQTDDASSELDQEYSLLSGMTDVVNGAPSIVQQINNDKSTSQTLRDKAQAENDSASIDNISQANQLLDSAYSTTTNATSSDDLKSARDNLSSAEDILNGVRDALNSSSSQPTSQTQNSNSTNSTESSTTNSTGNGTTSSTDQTPSGDNTTNTAGSSNSTNSTAQSNGTSANGNATS